ncbi:MAG: 3-oxoadipate enol-lactonase [Alphaproteobacteria bacterium]|nr:3-oxoadipate enol-lactonase [Alphaproteobacteria bacterium]
MPFVDIPGARLFHRFDGPADGPVVLLSNSLGTTHAMWEPQMPALTRAFRVLRYDTRGHGHSSVPPGPYTIEALGRDALELIDRLALPRIHVCGLSMGGMVAMWLAANAPARIQRVVLANTSARIGVPEVWNRRIETVAAHGMGAIVDGVIERWFTPGFRERERGEVARIAKLLRGTDPAGYAACCAAVRDSDLLDSLAPIKAATLVIAGKHDAATPPDHAKAIVARIRGARLATFDAAHLSNVECASSFTAALLDFLHAPPGS